MKASMVTAVVKKITKATLFKFVEMIWALAEHMDQGLMDGGRIIGQGGGGRIYLIACYYNSSTE